MSETDLELERLRRAFASLEGRAPGSGCPEPERLWSAARGELPADVVRPLVRHLVECGACAEAWRLAREVEPRPVPSAVVATPAPARFSRIGWGALAAGMTAALAAWVVLHQPERLPGFREGTRNEIRSLIPEADALPRAGFVLRWSPGPEGTTYNLEAGTDRLERIAEARGLTAAEYVVPEDALRTVPAGARVLWRVEMVLPDGRRAGSATFRTRVQ